MTTARRWADLALPVAPGVPSNTNAGVEPVVCLHPDTGIRRFRRHWQRDVASALRDAARALPCRPWRRARASMFFQVTGLDAVTAELCAGRSVVLATSLQNGSHRVVSALGARLRPLCDSTGAVIATVVLEPGDEDDRTSEVRMFGRPMGVSDRAALLALSLNATLFPAFSAPLGLLRHRVSIEGSIRVRSGSDGELRRVAQRSVWAWERFLREAPVEASRVARSLSWLGARVREQFPG